MKKLFVLLCLVSAALSCRGQPVSGAVTIKEEDGSPSVTTRTLKVTNGTLTANSDGSASLATGGGAGSASWGSISGTIGDQTDLTSALAAKLSLSGGTMTGNFLFTDNTYDIGASGATRPRTGYFGTSVITPAIGSASGSDFTITSGATNQNIVLTPNGTGQIRLNTASGGVRLPSTATAGLQLYNTSDETTNYEQGSLSWTSNELRLVASKGGSGSGRSIRLTAQNGGVGFVLGNNPFLSLEQLTTSTAGTIMSFASTGGGSMTATSGSQVFLSVGPVYNQTSGTAANTDFKINRTETAVGSGAQLLADFQVGGTSKFSVSNAGRVAVAGATQSTSTALITPASTTSVSSLRIPHGSAPTSPTNGDVWTTTGGVFVRVNSTTRTMANLTEAQTLTNKTLTAPQLNNPNHLHERFTRVAHGTMGATETFDLDAGNWHTGTLDANCTFTFSNWAATGSGDYLMLILTEDGTGGWTVTLPAAVVNKSEIEASINTTAGAVNIITFVSDDAGTTIYGTNATASSASVASASTTVSGITKYSTNGETTSGEAVQGNDGRLTKRLGFWTPESGMWQPSSAFATFNTRNDRPVYEFDASSAEHIRVRLVVTENALLTSGITVSLRWMAASATSGDVVWGAKAERSNTDADADSFDTAQTATGTANGTSGIETVTNITLTNIDSVAASEGLMLDIYRDAADGSDTMTGDAQLKSIVVLTAN